MISMGGNVLIVVLLKQHTALEQDAWRTQAEGPFWNGATVSNCAAAAFSSVSMATACDPVPQQLSSDTRPDW